MRILLFLTFLTMTSLFAPIHSVVEKWGTDVSGPQRGPIAPSVQRNYKQMRTLSASPDWSAAHRMKSFQGMRTAHFELAVDDLDRQSYEVTFYVATESSKKKQRANLRVVLQQGPEGSRVRVFNAQGQRVTGDVPMISEPHETNHTALLPWRDHTAMFYSLLIQTVEQQPCIVLIQHSRNRILKEGLKYRPTIVWDMLQTYRKAAPQLGLSERPHAYLDRVEHMRALPLPYTHSSYGLTLSEPLHITWSATGGTVKVHVRR